MARNELVGIDGRIEFTLDGLTFRRAKAEAEARGVERLYDVGWAEVDEAAMDTTGTGKPVVHVRVAGSPLGLDRKRDPYAVKLKRGMADEASAFVALVNDEIATRRRWEAAGA